MVFKSLNAIEKAFWETAKSSFVDRYLVYGHLREEVINESVSDADQVYCLFGLPDESFDKCLENLIYESCINLNCDCEYDVAIDIINKNIIITIKSPVKNDILTITKIEECLIIVD